MIKWEDSIKMDLMEENTVFTSTMTGAICISSEHENETLGSIKGGEFLDQQSKRSLMTKDSAP
jgi:hypothetical protein